MSSRFYWRLAVLTVSGVAIAVLGFTTGTYLRFAKGGKIAGHSVPFVRQAFGGKQQITLLVLGLDEKDKLNPKDGQRTDSIMLLKIDLARRSVKGLSIPRDTLTEIPGRKREDKINSAYTLGGVDASISAVEHLTTVHPDYYLVSDVSGFRQIVDRIGGIDLDVEKDMDYDDNWQNLHIHLKQGFQHLDGEHAMEYVRFRHDQFGDITRMQRQQKFMKAVAQRMMALSNLPKLPQIIGAVRDTVQTNIEASDLAYLATTLRSASGENIKLATIPEEAQMIHHISYLIPDEAKTKTLVAQIFDVADAGGPATVEVLNGSGRRGIASALAKKISDSGFKVVRIANADRVNYDTSLVLYRPDNEGGASEIVGMLGVGEASPEEATGAARSEGGAVHRKGRRRAVEQPNSDITVIVGKDYVKSGL